MLLEGLCPKCAAGDTSESGAPATTPGRVLSRAVAQYLRADQSTANTA